LNKHHKKGFLLVEMIVALSVVAIVLGALLQVFSHSLKNGNAARKAQFASYLAEEILWESFWEENLTDGWTNGTFSEYPKYRWSRHVELIYHPEPDVEEEESKETSSQGANERHLLPETDLVQIRVYVNWEEYGIDKHYELATYKVTPVPTEDEDKDEKL